MSKNKEINPKDLLLFFLNERVLISFFSILFMLIFFLYSINSDKDFQTRIIIKEPSRQLFEPYNSTFFGPEDMAYRSSNSNNLENSMQIRKSYLQSQFVISFNQKIQSMYNFRDFINQNNEFKKFYTSKNINLEEYFDKSNSFNKSNFRKIGNQDKNNGLFYYYFFFPEKFPGDIFLKDYIEFTKNKTIVEFAEEIKKTIASIVESDENLQKIRNDKYSSSDDYKNFNQLSEKIKYNLSIVESINYNKFNYDFFLEISKPAPVVKNYKFLYSLLGLSLGFFLSLIVIFFKNFTFTILKN
jgi:LPS O-antigen subunit length determinant protein (WzzB/FepE family)